MSAIPKHELDLLQLTAEDAAELAAEGELEEGYSLLQGGLYRAEMLAGEAAPWGEELVAHWKRALHQYAVLYAPRGATDDPSGSASGG